MGVRSVRDATFDVCREYGLTSLFANPGSTEIDLLTDLPDDLRFVLALHESSVVGIATGFAIGNGEPALAILHTTAGLGNAVGALATARVNRAPLVVHRRSAGPAASRGRAVSRGTAAWARGRLPGVDRRARPAAGCSRCGCARVSRSVDRARARARDRADGRLGRTCGRDSGTGGGTSCREGSRGGPRRDRRTCDLIADAEAARRSSPVRVRAIPTHGTRSSHWPSASSARSGRSRSGRGPGSRKITRCSQAICRPTVRGCARRSRRTTSCSPSARRCSGSTRTWPGRSSSRARGSPW